MPDLPRYRQIADHFIQAIQSGTLPVHHRLPSVRPLAQQHGISVTTAMKVLRTLEDEHFALVRKHRKLSVDALARQSGVPNSTIRKFEATGNISLRQFLMLYEVLGNLNDLNAFTSQVHAPTSIEKVLKNA